MSASRIGLRYMAESALYFSLMTVFVRLASDRGIAWQQIVFARAIFALVVTWFWLRHLHIDPWGNKRGWLAARGVFGFVALMCFYYAVTRLPLGDVTVIQYTNPAFVALFAVVIVAERLRLRDIGAAAICLTGVVLIARPSFLFGGESRLDPFDVGVALCGAVISAVGYSIVRRLGRTEHHLVTVLWFPLIATPIALPMALMAEGSVDAIGLLFLLGVGVSSQAAQIRMTQGLSLERAGRATAVTYLQIVFAFVFGAMLFGEIPTLWSVTGSLIVIATTVAVAFSADGLDPPADPPA